MTVQLKSPPVQPSALGKPSYRWEQINVGLVYLFLVNVNAGDVGAEFRETGAGDEAYIS